MRMIEHIDEVDTSAIQAVFLEDRSHRVSLLIPFKKPFGNRVLCVVGQNPSSADETRADSTVRYLEKLIVSKALPYRAILMLNLFTRVDTRKDHAIVDAKNGSWRKPIVQAAEEHEDFLMVFGKLKRQGPYDFPARALEVAELLGTQGKHKIYKLGIQPPSLYAPHPGNPKIWYRNLDISFVRYNFEDLKP